MEVGPSILTHGTFCLLANGFTGLLGGLKDNEDEEVNLDDEDEDESMLL